MTIHLYTDGSTWPNPGPGGWAVVDDEGELVAAGGRYRTTNNEMEGRALLEALRHLDGAEGVIHTDSMLWVSTLTQWARSWERKGWLKRDGKPPANLELVQEAYALYRASNATVVHVKGHASSKQNNAADRFAGLQTQAYTAKKARLVRAQRKQKTPGISREGANPGSLEVNRGRS